MENNFNITSASVSDRGLSEKRPENEDSFLVLEERGVYAVADGVGGAQAGEVASQMAVEIIGEAFINSPANSDAEDVMRVAIEHANSAIFQMASDLPQLSSMATTIVALHVDGNIATIGHVGDSRIYRLDNQGSLFRETNDHSVVEEEVRAGRMTPEQAQNHPSKNVISRALGAESDVEIDLKTIMIEPGTTFLLCSDGITRHIGDTEIAGFLTADEDPTEVCTRLKAVCYDRGAEDNLTAVIVRVEGQRATEYSVAAAGAGAAHDGEDPTIATARSPFDTTVDAETGSQPESQPEFQPESEPEVDSDLVTAETVAIDELDDQSYLMEEPDDPTEAKARTDLEGYSSSSVIVPAQPPPPPTAPRASPYLIPVAAEERSSGGASKILSGILFLLLGVVLGAGAYYFWLPSPPAPVVETPVITEMKSNNVPLNAFEEGRRLVDKDPAAYINANAASAREVDDYFLLGRAFMLTGKYWEAKRAFQEARNRLATADPNNARTLATEISMALAIIESSEATETFTKDMATAGSTGSANSNTNAAPPTQPNR